MTTKCCEKCGEEMVTRGQWAYCISCWYKIPNQPKPENLFGKSPADKPEIFEKGIKIPITEPKPEVSEECFACIHALEMNKSGWCVPYLCEKHTKEQDKKLYKPSPASTEELAERAQKSIDIFHGEKGKDCPVCGVNPKKWIEELASHDQQLRQRIVAGISEKADEYINQCASRIPSAEPTIRGFVEYLNPPVSTNLK